MKGIIVCVILAAMMAVGCADGATLCNSRGDDCRDYEPYGIFDTEVEDENVVYKVSPETVVVSVLFLPSTVIPICLVGWYLWEPVSRTD